MITLHKMEEHEHQSSIRKSATLRSFVLNVLLAMKEMKDRVEGPVVCEDGVCQAVIDGKMREWDEFGTTLCTTATSQGKL